MVIACNELGNQNKHTELKIFIASFQPLKNNFLCILRILKAFESLLILFRNYFC